MYVFVKIAIARRREIFYEDEKKFWRDNIPAILVLLASFLRFARVFFFFDFLTFNLPCAMLCVVVSLLKPSPVTFFEISDTLRGLRWRYARFLDGDGGGGGGPPHKQKTD